MSFASGGVVYSPTAGTAGSPALEMRYGMPLSLGAGAVIPAGTWIAPASYAVVSADGTSHTFTGGWLTSDGVNVTLVAAGIVIPVGRR